ncbi:MAG: glutamyl-tRNA reductase [Candidatus Nezhaarchaeota archaeon]|nr:glutamyl-tRNA reductase [Candidatus Nezhaarchaeota archaeon]MCX8141218.1 glutamyl-tRNA reductase [Candidatus Nezhaarchaeota archaeon]MDW8049484.1 glutamyl-tRNA reductase [Nitrososphaerota archaeon]
MEVKDPQQVLVGLYCYAITHRKAGMKILDKCQIHELVELKNHIKAEELIALQTCNRVEVYFIGRDDSLSALKEFLSRRAGFDINDYAELYTGLDAARHLYRVACGLESMFVGEEEILGQVKRAFSEAEALGTIGYRLRALFEGAILAGKRAREETAISKGAVSVPSVAVKRAEKLLKGLEDKVALVVGAGEAGELIVKELVKRKSHIVLIANRTFERAVKLAEKFHGHPVKLDELELPAHLAKADVVFVATKAPHLIIKSKHVEEALKIGNHKLLIFDLAVPRNVDESIESLPLVEVYTIEELKAEAEENLKMRIGEIPRVERIIEEELMKLQAKFFKLIKLQEVREVMKGLEEVRRGEVERALHKLKAGCSVEKVIDLLSRSLTKKVARKLVSEIYRRGVSNNEILSQLMKILGGQQINGEVKKTL